MATIPASDHSLASLSFVDAYDNAVDAPAFVATPTWSSSDTNLTVTPAADGLTADVSPVGPVLTGAVLVVSYDTGAGAVSVTSEAIDVVAGAVAAATITFGDPVAK